MNECGGMTSMYLMVCSRPKDDHLWRRAPGIFTAVLQDIRPHTQISCISVL